MEKLTDSEVLARLIYRAYIAPDPHAPLEAEALLPFTAALELYARTWGKEKRDEESYGMLLRMAAEAGVKLPEKTAPEPAVPDPDTAAEPEPPADTHTAGTNDGGELTPRLFAGYGAGEKREIYARLMAFVAGHGLGARRKIAETSNGALQLSDVQDMTDAKRVPLSKWRVAAAAMDRIEEQEIAQ